MSRAKDIWEDFAVNDAYYGVATFDKFRRPNLDSAAKEDFFQSGREHVAQIWNEIESAFRVKMRPRRALDYGCGVGRILIALAEKCETVVGVDIAAGMLAETRRNCADRKIENVCLQSAGDFLAADPETFDLVHSFIVLQHIDPQIGDEIIEQMVKRLEPGGIGMLHVTYFDPSPAFKKLRFRVYRDVPFVHTSLNVIRGKREPLMPMYEYDLNRIYQILQANGCGSTFARFTDHGWLGMMIFFQKDLMEMTKTM